MEATIEGKDPLLGARIADRLLIEALIGEGAMGRVYRALHLGLDKPVAVKLLSANLAIRSPIALERFRREARAASRVEHPNVVRVLDFGEDGPGASWYIVMELVEGEDLGQILDREGAFAPERARRIVEQTLEALSSAHQAGFVHRDIKPRNLLRLAKSPEGTDQIKVCDFGLAKAFDAAPSEAGSNEITRAGAFCGTPAFMAPEQVVGGAVDPRTDVYAAGALLYKLLTTESPFGSAPRATLFERVLQATPSPPSKLNPAVSPRLDAIVLRALEKDPLRRFQSAIEMSAALKVLVDEPAVAPHQGPSIERSREERLDRLRKEKVAARRVGWWSLGGIVALLAFALGVHTVLRSRAHEVPAVLGAPTTATSAPDAVLPLEGSRGTPQDRAPELPVSPSEPPGPELAPAPVPAPEAPAVTNRPLEVDAPRVVLGKIGALEGLEPLLRPLLEARNPDVERCLSQSTKNSDAGAFVMLLRAEDDHFVVLSVRDRVAGGPLQGSPRASTDFGREMQQCLTRSFSTLRPPPSLGPIGEVRLGYRFRAQP